MINKTLDLGIPEAAETYSSSEHFYKEMHIPASATGRLPKSSRTREGLAAEKVEDLGETGKNHRGGSSERGRSSGSHGGAHSGGPSSRGKGSGSGAKRGPAEGRERAAAERTNNTEHPKSTEDAKPRRSRNRRRTRGGQGDSAGADAATA